MSLKLHQLTECGGTVTDPSGVLTTTANVLTNCVWNIKVKANYIVKLDINQLNFGSQRNDADCGYGRNMNLDRMIEVQFLNGFHDMY